MEEKETLDNEEGSNNGLAVHRQSSVRTTVYESAASGVAKVEHTCLNLTFRLVTKI
jgi:hypothetical protein